jgi:glycosyltransferase involved in cell wall biosynthesis
VHVVLAGDGPDRQAWEQLAAQIQAREPRVRIEFPGWLARDAIETLFANADLLVLPSLWPEPFGLVGLEAARHRLPVAAFSVGGISDWLRPGVNGYLASGDPPTARGLAEAIIACLNDSEIHARLCDGAARLSAKLTFDRHVDALLRVFADVTQKT